jgi:hypothetical protein
MQTQDTVTRGLQESIYFKSVFGNLWEIFLLDTLIAVLTSAVCDASKRSLIVLCTVSGQVPCSVAKRRHKGLDVVSTAILDNAFGENKNYTALHNMRF